MTTLENRPNTALLVVDAQRGVVARTHERDTVVATIRGLVERARQHRVPVVWVQHSGEEVPRGGEAWRIVPELAPDGGEPVVHKSYGDSFEATDLEGVLARLGVGRLVVAGAQSDGCIRCTARWCAATTPCSSPTPTPPRTSPRGAHRHRRR
ncbi:hypothetical protein GCM10023225_03870 [Kineococcus glutinatus]|uniref:Isochorismatase-like domain-containing protein n=1 Tax=Kineococcus glutinatus TaxID=1070872 RepID=A0ABP9H8C2_9ACTN